MQTVELGTQLPPPRRPIRTGPNDLGPTVACEKCGRPSRPVGCEPDPETGLGDLYTYECAACGHVQTRTEGQAGPVLRDRQQMLLREMCHRTQNLIAVIQGIARLTFRNSVPAEKQEFGQRLLAVGRAHTLLADAAWQGVSLSEILHLEFAAFPNNLVWSGCDVVLSAGAAEQLALIIHELATNAVKHGSLSVHDGRVAVEGKMEDGGGEKSFRFIWQEIGGPTVMQPERRGFGTTVLVQGARNLGPNVAMDFFPSGLRYELQLPASAFIAAV